MVSDPNVESIAARVAMEHERSLGREVRSVETENCGYDLLSTQPRPTESGAYLNARFIEVRERGTSGEVALTSSEFGTAQRLGNDYRLYVVFDCTTIPTLRRLQNPAKLEWQRVVKVEHYCVSTQTILEATGG